MCVILLHVCLYVPGCSRRRLALLLSYRNFLPQTKFNTYIQSIYHLNFLCTQIVMMCNTTTGLDRSRPSMTYYTVERFRTLISNCEDLNLRYISTLCKDIGSSGARLTTFPNSPKSPPTLTLLVVSGLH